jgi:hypothetical protein
MVSYVNNLAYEAYKQIKIYDVKLSNPLNQTAPTSYKQAGNRESQWFSAEDKEYDEIIEFTTWQRLAQSIITPDLRCVRQLYDFITYKTSNARDQQQNAW